jgi:hypothetical protein
MGAMAVDCRQKTFSEKELAALMGVSRQAVQKRAGREGWPYEWADGNGGKVKRYRRGILPIDYQACIAKLRTTQAAALIGGPDSPELAGYEAARNYLEDMEREADAKRLIKEKGLAAFAELPEARKRSAEACYEILRMKESFVKAGGFKTTRGTDLFCAAVNEGQITIPDWIVQAAGLTGKLHPATLYRWSERYNTLGMAGLAKNYGKNAGRTLLTKEQQDYVQAMIAAHPTVSIPKLLAGLAARFRDAEQMPAPHVVYNFARRWKYENRALLLSLTNPDKFKSEYGSAIGSASANVFRLNQVWEADATPGDIMLAEGRHTVIACIDVWSRRPKVLVVPSSKAQAIAALLRRCILDWGVPEVLRTDNGKDFTARHMERVLDSLEIEHDLCAPFTPEQKPHVERFIGTFSHGIVELLPGYIGHSVAERKDIEARKSFAARLMKKGSIVEVKLTAGEFQAICDRWIDAVYMQDTHGGLEEGMTPAAKVRSWTELVRRISDERALDVLLSPAPKDGGWREVRKKGVDVDRRHYYNTAMIGYEGKRVQVLIDYSDIGKAYIFAESGKYICTAIDTEWSGISAADLASHSKQLQKKFYADGRKEMRKKIREQKISLVPEEILKYRESLLENVREIPKKTEEYTTLALEEAAYAVADADRKPNQEALAGKIELPPEVLEYEEKQKKVVDLKEKRREQRMFDTDEEIYCWVLDRIKDGTVTAIQRQWKKEYEAWQDTSMRRPFKTGIGIADLMGDGESATAAL